MGRPKEGKRSNQIKLDDDTYNRVEELNEQDRKALGGNVSYGMTVKLHLVEKINLK